MRLYHPLIIGLFFLQLIISPWIYYIVSDELNLSVIGSMQVEPITYFSYSIPALLFFSIGLLSGKKDKQVFSQYLRSYANRFSAKTIIGVYLLLYSLSFFDEIIPISLRFYFQFIASFQYSLIFVAIIRKNMGLERVIVYLIVIGLACLKVIKTAMFGELVIILTLAYIMRIHIHSVWSFSKAVKLSIIAFGLLFIVQIIKPQLRQMQVENSIAYNIQRMNQGSIVTNIMNEYDHTYTPQHGRTYLNAVAAAFIPRIIWKEKPLTGQALVERYAHVDLGPNTSMGLSHLGEAYVNFGVYGSIFMYIVGFSVRLTLYFITFLSLRLPNFVLLVPVILMQLIKCETDFNRTIGYSLKMCLLGFVFFSILNALWVSRKEL